MRLPFRGFKQPGRLPHVFQANEFNANTWVDEKEVPYTYDPQHPYNWVRVRLFGGRSLFWSRQSFRLSDYEFKGKSHDGFGDDWPISLADLAPYYSRVEAIFRVRGRADGLPQYPDGNFVPDDSPWSGCMQRFVAAGKQMGVPVCKPRSSLGVDGLASSDQPAAARRLRDRQAASDSQRGRPRAQRGQEHRPGERGPLRRSPLAARNVGQGARGRSGGGHAGEHAPAAELQARQLQRRDGPLSDRPDLRPGHCLFGARGARRQSHSGTDGRRRAHSALPQYRHQGQRTSSAAMR